MSGLVGVKGYQPRAMVEEGVERGGEGGIERGGEGEGEEFERGGREGVEKGRKGRGRRDNTSSVLFFFFFFFFFFARNLKIKTLTSFDFSSSITSSFGGSVLA